MPTANSAMDL